MALGAQSSLMINSSLSPSRIGTYFHCVSVHINGSDRDMQYGSPNGLNDRTHVFAAHGARRLRPLHAREKLSRVRTRESLTFTSQPVSSRDTTEETWQTGSQAAVRCFADARGAFATRGSTLPVNLRCACANRAPTGFQSPFCQKCVPRQRRPWLHFPPRRWKSLRWRGAIMRITEDC